MISLFTITELKFVLGSAKDKALIIVINQLLKSYFVPVTVSVFDIF